VESGVDGGLCGVAVRETVGAECSVLLSVFSDIYDTAWRASAWFVDVWDR